MTLKSALITALMTATALPFFGLSAQAEGELNLYSSRHYDTDERLYSDFEAATGITINRIEGKENELIERMKAEGANSPADVFLTTDAGRLWAADEEGLFQSTESAALAAAIPANMRDPANHWFGFSKRARVIYYDKNAVAEPPKTYAELADPKWKGQICIRSSSNIYSLSLLAAMIANDGEDAAKAWAAGVNANLARDPEGGDTDQIKGVASGACTIAVGNTYYWARALRKAEDWAVEAKDRIGVVFPDQDGRGTHVNISGGGVAAHAPNRENAVKFLEYLASPAAQEYFANGNDEYPVVDGVAASSIVVGLGSYKEDVLNVAAYGENQAKAQEIYNAVGFK